MSSMPSSTANWHWKNKNITNWGREWFERELTTVKITGDGEEKVSITKVTEVDGDIELGQRKSKLITIYDCKIEMTWSGTAEDGTEVSGKLTIPEVSHETTLDKTSGHDYQWSLSTKSSPVVAKVFSLVKSLIPIALEQKFEEFPTTIIEVHGKDLQVSAEPSRTGTPVPAPSSSAGSKLAEVPATSGPKVTAVKREAKPLNTEKVTVEASFAASAEDLFGMLTDEGKIPMWTRSAAQSKPEPDTPFSLFGGGVKGTFVSVDRPSKVVQKWALSSPSWPSDHFATMTITLNQSSDSTKLSLSLDGVPTGMQEEIKRNLEGYYIHGLKSIGYVQLIHSPSYPTSASRRTPLPPHNKTADDSTTSSRTLIIVLAVLVLVAAFAIPFR